MAVAVSFDMVSPLGADTTTEAIFHRSPQRATSGDVGAMHRFKIGCTSPAEPTIFNMLNIIASVGDFVDDLES